MTKQRSKRYIVLAIGALAVMAAITWLAEVELGNDVVYGTGFGAVLFAAVFWFFDLRRRRHQRAEAQRLAHLDPPASPVSRPT